MNSLLCARRGALLSVPPSSVPDGLDVRVGLPVQISQLLRPGKSVGIDSGMVFEPFAGIEYESASERGERHGTSMSGLNAWDDFLGRIGFLRRGRRGRARGLKLEPPSLQLRWRDAELGSHTAISPLIKWLFPALTPR